MQLTRAFSLLAAFVTLASCSVKNDPATIGALNCNPTATQVSNFQIQVYNTMQSVNPSCIMCHGLTASADQYKTRFKLSINSNQMAENYCVTYLLGPGSPDQVLINHPQDPKHGGGRYSDVTLQPIIQWVQSFSQ